jgi:hypothetical protein
MKIDDLFFRSWYYLQLGWQVYFAIIFALINFITLMYAFVINDYEFLQIIFPDYLTFALVFSLSIFTICSCMGYRLFHSGERRAQIDINFEINPYAIRRTANSEMMLNTYLIICNLLVLKNQQKDPSTEKRINEYSEKLNSIRDIMENRTMRNKLDMKVIKTETDEN